MLYIWILFTMPCKQLGHDLTNPQIEVNFWMHNILAKSIQLITLKVLSSWYESYHFIQMPVRKMISFQKWPMTHMNNTKATIQYKMYIMDLKHVGYHMIKSVKLYDFQMIFFCEYNHLFCYHIASFTRSVVYLFNKFYVILRVK